MTNLRDANFTLTDGDGVTKRSFGDRLEDEWITVLDFGADPTGATDSTTAIQDTFDNAFGTYADPHGSPDYSGFGPEMYTNKVVYFPAGDYKVSSTLTLNLVMGGTILGAGSYQTRIFWDPGAPEYTSPETEELHPYPTSTPSSLLECRTCWKMNFEGFTLDASDVQKIAMRSTEWNNGDSGSGAYYRDMHFTNAPDYSFFSGGDAMGSERTFFNCRFTNSTNGHMLWGGNALNHSFYNCYFANCVRGASQLTGGSGTLFHCRFENNSEFDIKHTESQLRVIGCHSTSPNFARCDGIFNSNTHAAAVPGVFWMGMGIQAGAFKGNYSSNGYFDSGGQVGIHLVGNIFDDPDYLDLATLPIWINGIEV